GTDAAPGDGDGTSFSFPTGNRTAENWTSQTSPRQGPTPADSMYHESTGIPVESAPGGPGGASSGTRSETGISGVPTGSSTGLASGSGSRTGLPSQQTRTGTASGTGG